LGRIFFYFNFLGRIFFSSKFLGRIFFSKIWCAPPDYLMDRPLNVAFDKESHMYAYMGEEMCQLQKNQMARDNLEKT